MPDIPLSEQCAAVIEAIRASEGEFLITKNFLDALKAAQRTLSFLDRHQIEVRSFIQRTQKLVPDNRPLTDQGEEI
jgi:hypothetical protein